MATRISARVHAIKHKTRDNMICQEGAETGDPGYPESKDRVPGVLRAPPGGDRVPGVWGPGVRGSYQCETGCPGWTPGARDSYSGHKVPRSGAQTQPLQSYLHLRPLACIKVNLLYQNVRDKRFDH